MSTERMTWVLVLADANELYDSGQVALPLRFFISKERIGELPLPTRME